MLRESAEYVSRSGVSGSFLRVPSGFRVYRVLEFRVPLRVPFLGLGFFGVNPINPLNPIHPINPISSVNPKP